METTVSLPQDVFIGKRSVLYRLPIVLFALGLGAILYWGALYGADPARAMFGYLYGFIVVLTLALGSLGFVLIQHLTRAGWCIVVRRIPEAVIALMPLLVIFFIPIALSMHDIFPWTHHEHIDEILTKKLGYLNENFFLMRSFGYLLLWSLMGVWLYRSSVSQDAGHRFDISRRLMALSAPGIILFGLSLTFAAFDWLMSLQPHWYSTIFGIYFFAGCFLFALSFMTLIAMALQKTGLLKNAITPEHYHDLGKLMFGFTVFWAYISFSQFMLYWYAGIPEEIEFYTHRMHNGWGPLSWAIPVFHFIIPFLLLMSRFLKRIKIVLAFNCLWVIGMHLADLYWLILPTYVDPTVEHGPTHLQVKMVDVLGVTGLLFIFVAFFLFVLGRQKVIPIGDPRLVESMTFENF